MTSVEDYHLDIEVEKPATEQNGSTLSPDHAAYLNHRHGTTNFKPLPSMDPNDPYNWPSWKKNANLFIVALQGLTTVLNAAGVIPAFPLLIEALDISVHKLTYLIGVQILFLGIAPLFWKPIANRYGRRPIWLISSLCGGICNIGCVYSTSYGTLITTRILVAIFLSPALGLGGAVVTETFFAHQRARKLGIWTLAFTIGPSLGPLLAGFIVYHTNNWQWVFWFFTILSFATIIATIFLAPETLYLRDSPSARNLDKKQQYLSIGKINSTPFHVSELYQPYLMLVRPSVLIPACAYAMVFCVASPGISIIIPTAYIEIYGLNTQQVGLQFIAVLVGAILGEQIGGLLSDVAMRSKGKSGNVKRAPEFRLWASYLGFATVIDQFSASNPGILEWGITLNNAKAGHWTVVPEIGLGLLSFGLQIVTTVLVTYAIDCNPHESAAVGGAINQVRQIWSFIGPFWFVPMYESLGFSGSAGLMAGLTALMIFPVVAIHIFGRRWHHIDGCHEEPLARDEKMPVGPLPTKSVNETHVEQAEYS